MLHVPPFRSGPNFHEAGEARETFHSPQLLAQGCAIRVQFFAKTVNLTAPLLSSFLTDLSKEASQMAQGCVTSYGAGVRQQLWRTPP